MYMSIQTLVQHMKEIGDERTEATEHQEKIRFMDAVVPYIAACLNETSKRSIEHPKVRYRDLVKKAI